MKVSIITISYNDIDGLKRTAQSVLGQSDKSFEYLIIDGGSKDGTFDYLETIKDRVDFCVSEPDEGIYNAMNKGIAHAKEEYLLFLNSGDVFSNNNVIKEVLPLLTGEDIVYGNGKMNTSEGKVVDMIIPEILDLPFFVQRSLVHPSTFIKKKLFDLVGNYNEGNKIVSDWEFFINTALKHNCSYKKIDLNLSIIEDGGISRNQKYQELLASERDQVLNNFFNKKEIDEALIMAQERNKPAQKFKKGNLVRRMYRSFKRKI